MLHNTNENPLIFYLSLKKPESNPPRKEDLTINIRTPRLYSQFDICELNSFKSSSVEIFLGDIEIFKEDLINDFLNFPLISGKTFIPFPSIGGIITKYKVLLTVKYSLDIVEGCFPEFFFF